MKHLTLFLILLSQLSFAQQKNPCLCLENNMTGTVKNEKPKMAFNFKDGNGIILCGYKQVKDGKTLFSEFVLLDCNTDKVIDFWDALFSGTVSFENETIYIKEIKNLPTGQSRSFTPTHWSTETLTYKGNQIVRAYSVNKSIRKYTKSEIDATLKEFEGGSKNYKGDVEDLMYRLFLSAISGDVKARKYFSEFRKFTLVDGAISEGHTELTAMLKLWDSKS